MKLLMSVVLGLLLSFHCFANQGKTFDTLIVFGDSLSDNGNLYDYMWHFLPKSPPYYKGRFSNGPIWVEQLIQTHYPEKSLKDFKDYAVGGAGAVIEKKGNLPYTLAMQINDYLYWHPKGKSNSSLIIIWIGANNYLNGPTNTEEITDTVTKAIRDSIVTLIKNGANKILLANLPDMSYLPQTKIKHSEALLKQLTLKHNAKLKANYEVLKQEYPQVDFIYFDAYAFFDEAIKHPDKYHLSNVDESCYEGSYTGFFNFVKFNMKQSRAFKAKNKDPFMKEHWEMIKKNVQLREALRVSYLYEKLPAKIRMELDCRGYLFWDNVHPTAYAHSLIAEKVHSVIKNAGLTLAS